MATLTLDPLDITLAASNDDFTPSGGDTSSFWRADFTAVGTATLTGMLTGSANVTGRVVIIANLQPVIGNRRILVTHEDSASTASNRFTLPGGTSLIIGQLGAAGFIYDGTSARWRVFSLASAYYNTITTEGLVVDGAISQSNGSIQLGAGGNTIAIGATTDVVTITSADFNVIDNSSGTSSLRVNASDVSLTAKSFFNSGINTQGIRSTSISGSNNNLNPGGNWPQVAALVENATAAATITGFDATGVASGHRFLLINSSTTNSITCSHQSTSSSSANRISCPNNASFTIPPNGSCSFFYVSSHWQLLP